jgi:hypothetical protein
MSIESLSKATIEINYNSIYEKLNSGCYLATYSSTYDSTNANGAYDTGASFQFFNGTGVDTTMTASANSSTITVASATGISTGMRVIGDFIPADAYVTNVSGTTVTISPNTSGTISAGTPVSFFSYKIAEDKERNALTPLSSIFTPNRPDAGIVNLVAYRKGSSVIPLENLKIGNLGSIYNGTASDRVYPISKNSSFKYWNSLRRVKSSNVISTVGLSNGSNVITHAAPFAVYTDSFYANKIVVKTQKYDGNYPVRFKVEYLPNGSNTWTTAADYSASDTSVLSDGKLEIFYNGSSWSTTPYASTKFTSATTDAIYMRGVRLSITKMSKTRIPAEVIEISPRLVLNVTDYTMSFDYSKAIANTSYGMPVAGTVSGSGSIELSNVDKYFSSVSGTSIIKNSMVQGAEDIPLGTFYATDWAESSNSSVSVSFEDYFYFLKRMKSPEISIANLSGIEASVALLLLFDNAGITNYRFVKQSATSDDDFVFDYFFTSETQTIAEVLEQIAISAQYAIYVDANNVIRAMTKEKMTDLVGIANTDFWLVGTEEWINTESEYSYLNGSYVANISSIDESKIIPITEAEIQYAGIGIKRQPKEILRKPELFNDKNIPYYNASIVNRGLSFVNTELWSIDSADVGSDKVLLSMPYISDISDTRPTILTVASNTAPGDNDNLSAKSQNDLIRTIYTNSTATDKKYFEIVVDQERGVEIVQSRKFNGHVVIDAELIKYNGIVVDVFDEKQPQNSGRFIVFDNAEFQYLINKSSSGVSVVCYSILVEILFKPKNITTALTSNVVSYEFLSDGRGQENTSVASHTKQTETTFSSNIIRTKLYATTVASTVTPQGTMSSKSINLLDPRNPSLGNTVSYPGYLKISGPKSIGGANKKVDFSDSDTVPAKKLNIDNLGEQFITGFYKTLTFSPDKISTRMRLLEKPKKQVFNGTSAEVKQPFENRGIAGIGFRLNYNANGVTGYYVEIEDIANITESQMENVDFKNLRLYKVIRSGSTYKPVVLAKAWVNVSAVAGESIDFGDVILNEGRSYAGTSDLSVVIETGTNNTTYKIYWETNLVCKYVEKNAERTNPNSTTIGLIVRSDSEAMFDYISATALAKNGKYRLPVLMAGNSEYITESEAAERGMLPVSLTSSVVGENSKDFYYEDFGNQMREVKKFSVSFEKPSVLSRLISLTKTNKDYYVTDYSYSSQKAEFWVFNTGRASIGLSLDMNTPLIISGIALEEINAGSINLSDYLKTKSSSYLDYINLNKNKYGENKVSLAGNYINNLDQAQKHLEWIYNKCGTPKKEFDIKMFANPLLELGDKVRIYNSDINHTIGLLGTDKVYYITSISYNVSGNGPEMNIRVREV